MEALSKLLNQDQLNYTHSISVGDELNQPTPISSQNINHCEIEFRVDDVVMIRSRRSREQIYCKLKRMFLGGLCWLYLLRKDEHGMK